VVNGLEITLIDADNMQTQKTQTQKRKKDASSRPGARNRTNGVSTGKGSKSRAATNATDWTKLRSRSATQIRKGINSDPEAHATDNAFWKHASVVLPVPKQIVTMRLDADLLQWFRQQPRLPNPHQRHPPRLYAGK
jgi:uncharacterized protein (DUF4415 family)